MESSFKAVRRPKSNRVPCNGCTAVWTPDGQSSACWSAEIDELRRLRDVFPAAPTPPCLGDGPLRGDSFWGDNYACLKRIKQKYDPDGLFFLHHGVGSEDWSADGFTR